MNKNIGKDLAWMTFYLFVGLTLVWTGKQTYEAVRLVLPNDPIAPFVALGLFDVGAFAWLMAFLKHAQGSQRTIAVVMLILDFTGTVVMVGGSLELFSARTIEVALLLSTLFNGAAIYTYHALSPHNRTAIAIQNYKDMAFDESLRQAERIARANMREHGAVMALGLMAQFKYDLGLPMTEAEKKALTEDVIDVSALDLSPIDKDAPKVAPAWWIAVLKALGKYRPVNIVNPTAAPQGAEDDSTAGQSQDSELPAPKE